MKRMHILLSLGLLLALIATTFSFGMVRADEPPRNLGLTGAPNFRDLGGYENACGLQVQWGKVYRSGHLAKLTDDDLAEVNALGWQRIVDLRMPYDVFRDGQTDSMADGIDRTYASNETKYDLLPFNYGDPYLRGLVPPPEPWTKNAIQAWSLSWDLTQVDFDDWYINIAESNRDGIRQVFERLADPTQYPIIVHCTQGKDRAGVISALLLMLLDVPNETVMADYMLTHDYTLTYINASLNGIKLAMQYMPYLFPPSMLPWEVGLPYWARMIDCYQPAMQNLLDYIEAQYGGAEGFLTSIGVDAEAQAAIRNNLIGTPEPCVPVPEVGTIVLMSMGFVGVGGFIWYRRRHTTIPTA